MKRWALLTTALYVLTVVFFTAPLTFLCFYTDERLFGFYGDSWYWTWIVIICTGQVLLLFVPIDIAKRRLKPRRKLLVPTITAAFMVVILALGTLFSVLFALWGDETFEFYEGKGLFMFTMIFILWCFWAFLFFRFLRADEPSRLIKRLMRWLLGGSILELLVAVPSHIIVRHRDDCCAPLGTFIGIVAGFSIMLLSFGPGVFFLFAERFQRLRSRDKREKDLSNSEQ